jgi:P4 family phage/plasmid primase-like protien
MPPLQNQKPVHDVLRDFLERNRSKGPEWNITGMAGRSKDVDYDCLLDAGKYNVPDTNYADHFLKRVHDTIFENGLGCALLERHLPHGGPILIDLDFKYTAGGALQRHFTDDMIRSFVLRYIGALFRFFDMATLKDKPLRFFVLKKDGPESEKGKHKDGIHIHCPDLTMTPVQQYTLRGYALQENMIQNIFDETGFTNAEPDVFDVSVIHRNNWFLYGATKPNKSWYQVRNVYRVSADLDVGSMGEDARFAALDEALEEEIAAEYTTLELTYLLSIRQGHDTLTTLNVTKDRKTEWEALGKMWGHGKALAMTNTIVHSPGMEGAAPPSNDMASMVLNPTPQYDDSDLLEGYNQEDIEQAIELVEKCLSPVKRAKDFGSWIDLGLCLFNICEEDIMMNKWATFSRRVDGYENTGIDVYSKAWRSFQNRDAPRKIRMGTLHFWAMEDNNQKYKDITEKTACGWVLNYPDATHVKVAELVKRLYRYEFCCTMVGRKDLCYFQYAGNFWKKLKSNNELRARLTNRVVRIYLLAQAEAARLAAIQAGAGGDLNKAKQEENKDKIDKMHEKQKILFKSCTLLEGAPFKENVMKECNEKFYDENFTDQLNQKKDIFACGNCVIELRHYPGGAPALGATPKVIVRKGRPDDYISFVMGRENELEPITMDYDTKTGELLPFDANTPEQKEIADFFDKVFPNPELREYVLTLLSACLEGENREQKFYIMTGGGGNGKSVLINLMRFTLGEYQTSLNTAALTRRRPESGAANPDIITLKSKRFIYMQEPDEGEKLNTARIKQFTGGDVVEARGLFADQEKFKIMGRIFFSTNDLPPVSSMDGGTWRRIEVIPFVSAFKEKGHPELDPSRNIYEKDINLEDKFKQSSMRAAFLRLLLHYWETKYVKHGLSRAPECVLEAINRYKTDNDSFIAFANETFVREQGSSAQLSEVIFAYKRWSAGQPPGRKQLKKPEIIERMSKQFKTQDGGKSFNGIRVILDGEDISGNYVTGQGFS